MAAQTQSIFTSSNYRHGLHLNICIAAKKGERKMFSWKIGSREYFAPMGYGEITVERYVTYMAILGHLVQQEAQREQPIKKGWLARLTRKLNQANERLKNAAQDDNEAWAKEYQAKSDFVAYWLRAHDIIDQLDPSDVLQIWEFLNRQWAAWQPRIVNQFTFDKLWTVDMSFESVSTVKNFADLQVVLSQLCKDSNGNTESPRYWGNVSLDVAASIMHTIKTKHAAFATIIGASILDHFNIEN